MRDEVVSVRYASRVAEASPRSSVAVIARVYPRTVSAGGPPFSAVFHRVLGVERGRVLRTQAERVECDLVSRQSE